jgi:hypothetical protein
MSMCQATFGLRLRSRPFAQNCEARAYGRTTPRDARPLRRLASRKCSQSRKRCSHGLLGGIRKQGSLCTLKDHRDQRFAGAYCSSSFPALAHNVSIGTSHSHRAVMLYERGSCTNCGPLLARRLTTYDFKAVIKVGFLGFVL